MGMVNFSPFHEAANGYLTLAADRIPFLPIPKRFEDISWTDIALSLAVVYFLPKLANTLITYIHVRLQVRGLPAIHSGIEFFENGMRDVLPHIPLVCPSNDYTLREPFKKYAKVNSDLIALTTPTLPYAVYISSNPRTCAVFAGKPALFTKPTDMWRYQAINLFGRQIVSVSGDEWRRHRAVVRGCFGESVMENAWDKMVDAVDVMIAANKLENGGVVLDVEDALIKVTLIVIGQAGFGIDVPWDIPKTDGPLLPFIEALQDVEYNMIGQLLVPPWLMHMAPIRAFNRMGKARNSLTVHLKRMAKSKRAELQAAQNLLPPGEKPTPPTDLYGALVASQMDIEAEQRALHGEKVAGLTESEVQGNLFIFIVAGHETTGHVLAFTMAYLALHPEWQDKLYAEIKDVCGDHPPTYRDVPHLRLVLAAAYETIRMRDIVMFIPKRATAATTIPYTTWDKNGAVHYHVRAVAEGSHLILDTPAAQLNPFFWPNPEVFDPTRHLRTLDEDANEVRAANEGDVKPNEGPFLGFSLGSRSCIGKRFAEVEIVAFLATVLERYSIHPVALEGESKEDTYKRMTQGHEGLTFMPGKFSVRFEPRH